MSEPMGDKALDTLRQVTRCRLWEIATSYIQATTRTDRAWYDGAFIHVRGCLYDMGDSLEWVDLN